MAGGQGRQGGDGAKRGEEELSRDPLSSRDPKLYNQLLLCVHTDLRKCTVGISSYPGDLLQVREGDGLAGQHLMGLAGERRQRRQLLPMGQAAAQHSQTGAVLPRPVHVLVLLHALGVCSRHVDDVAGCLGEDGGEQRLLISASRGQAVIVGLGSIEGFGGWAARVQQQLPLLSVLVRVLVLAAIAAPHGGGRAGRSGRAEEGRRPSRALPVT